MFIYIIHSSVGVNSENVFVKTKSVQLKSWDISFVILSLCVFYATKSKSFKLFRPF